MEVGVHDVVVINLNFVVSIGIVVVVVVVVVIVAVAVAVAAVVVVAAVVHRRHRLPEVSGGRSCGTIYPRTETRQTSCAFFIIPP